LTPNGLSLRSRIEAISVSRVAALKAEVPRVPKPGVGYSGDQRRSGGRAHSTENNRMANAKEIANSRVNHDTPDWIDSREKS